MTKQIAIFDTNEQNWIILKDGFQTEDEAQEFMDNFPRFGHKHSRSIREGNWQIVDKH
jgi:hypothetical protein